MKLIQRKVKLFRTILGVAQYDLAEQMGIPSYRLSLLETGRFRPRPKELKSLAKALGVVRSALTDAEETASLETLVREVYLKGLSEDGE